MPSDLLRPDPSSSPVSERQEEKASLSFDTFSRVNRQRCESPNGFNHALASWSTSDWFLAVLGELGEAANIAKKLNRVRDGIPGNKEPADALHDKLRRELGDAFVYLDLLAQSLNVSIGAAAVEVFNAKSDEIGCSIRITAPPPSSVSVAAAQKEDWCDVCSHHKCLHTGYADGHCAVNGCPCKAFALASQDLKELVRHFEEQAEVFDEAGLLSNRAGAAIRHEKQRVRDAYRDCATRLKAALSGSSLSAAQEKE